MTFRTLLFIYFLWICISFTLCLKFNCVIMHINNQCSKSTALCFATEVLLCAYMQRPACLSAHYFQFVWMCTKYLPPPPVSNFCICHRNNLVSQTVDKIPHVTESHGCSYSSSRGLCRTRCFLWKHPEIQHTLLYPEKVRLSTTSG